MAHGGARPGSGRRQSGPDSIQVNWRVSENAKAWIVGQAKERGISVAAIVDELVKVFEDAVVLEEFVRKLQERNAALKKFNAELMHGIGIKMVEKPFEEGKRYAIERACQLLEQMTEGRLGDRFIDDFRNALIK